MATSAITLTPPYPPEVEKALVFWRQGLHEWYPNLHQQPYFVPSVFFRKVPYSQQTVEGESILVVQPPVGADDKDAKRGAENKGKVFENDFRDDHAMEHVLYCLKALAEKEAKEVMIVLSQLDFKKYLDGQNDPIGAAATALLPRIDSLRDKNDQRGDFDILIVHKHYGLIVGEVKSVGYKFDRLRTEEEKVLKTIASRVDRAVKQLIKSGKVLMHLTKDLGEVKITKTLFLPNITSEQLTKALETNTKTQQESLFQCLGTSTLADAVALCLCADQVSPSIAPWEMSENVAATLAQWWTRCVKEPSSRWMAENGKGKAGKETDELYEQLLARFCGPATTFEIPTVTPPRKQLAPRTEGEGVAETGLRMSRITLLPEQVTLLNKPIPRLHIWGPPGTGKSSVLYLRGRGWMNQGHDVWVVSPGEKSLAASILIHHQLKQILTSPDTGTPSAGRPHFHAFDCKDDDDRDNAVLNLSRAAVDGRIHVIVDEALSYWGDKTFNTFCNELLEKNPQLYLWGASIHRPDLPDGFDEEILTIPLRCPPAVTREINQAHEINIWTSEYTKGSTPAPTDGQEVQWLQHEGEPGHSEGRSSDCQECGVVIAGQLRKLDVGNGSLKYKDILILCDNPHDEETDENGEVKSAIGVVQGLRSCGVTVQVVKEGGPEESYRDVALARNDVVTVTHYSVVMGLERMVVVGMGNVARRGERLKGMSRSTAKLMWVH